MALSIKMIVIIKWKVSPWGGAVVDGRVARERDDRTHSFSRK